MALTRFRFVALVSLALVSVAGCGAEATPNDDGPSASQDNLELPQRAAVMNALRAELKPHLKNQSIVFDVNEGHYNEGKGDRMANGDDDFVFMTGQIRLQSGGKVDYRGTEYQEYIDDGMFDDGFAALLHQESAGWVVQTFAIGSTDVPWSYWAWDYAAPRSIFPEGSVSAEGPLAETVTDLAGKELADVQAALVAAVRPELANQDLVLESSSQKTAERNAQWAFLSGQFRLRSGGPIDYSQTEYQQYIDEGMFDDGFTALLRKHETEGWKVEARAIGSTDVAWTEWAYEYGAPANLFPGFDSDQL